MTAAHNYTLYRDGQPVVFDTCTKTNSRRDATPTGKTQQGRIVGDQTTNYAGQIYGEFPVGTPARYIWHRFARVYTETKEG